MHGVYLFKAGCCCLPVLIGCVRAFLFVRAFAVQGCPVCNVIPSRKQRKVWHFSFFVSPVVITDGDMARAATSCGVVRSACGAAPNRQASSDAEAESAHLTATGGGVVASGNAPACAARLRRRGGWVRWGTRSRARSRPRAARRMRALRIQPHPHLPTCGPRAVPPHRRSRPASSFVFSPPGQSRPAEPRRGTAPRPCLPPMPGGTTRVTREATPAAASNSACVAVPARRVGYAHDAVRLAV